MIGKYLLRQSAAKCIGYCLRDKQQQVIAGKSLPVNRATILQTNLCFGTRQELTRQFKEVQQLNTRLAKPVLHITLSFAPEDRDKINREKMLQISNDCSADLGFANHQFIAIEHVDTLHPHFHMVVNRVGFDGKTLSDSNSYKKIAAHCRSMEQRYGLQVVLSPRRFLPKATQQLPRQDKRKETLKQLIATTLKTTGTYEGFVEKIAPEGILVTKGRGIAFTDKQGVYTKGSAIGFSLENIHQHLLQYQQHVPLKEKQIIAADMAQYRKRKNLHL